MKALSIRSLRTGQHFVTVAETPTGLKVIRGDDEMMERLGLLKYRDLAGVQRGVQRATELSAEEIEVVTGWSPDRYDRSVWFDHICAMIAELVEEGYDRDEIMRELVALGVDDFPGIDGMVDGAILCKGQSKP